MKEERICVNTVIFTLVLLHPVDLLSVVGIYRVPSRVPIILLNIMGEKGVGKKWWDFPSAL